MGQDIQVEARGQGHGECVAVHSHVSTLVFVGHKQVKDGELPPTRTVVSRVSGMGLSLSNILSDIVESKANMPVNLLRTNKTKTTEKSVTLRNKILKS